MIKSGWATRSIVPARPALVMGQMHRRIARRALDDITVTALALEGGQPRDTAIIISCDLTLVADDLHQAVRQRLRRALPGVPAAKVFLAATHTHTSFVCEDGFYPHPGGDVMTPAECTAWVAEQAAAAAVDAWRTRVPGPVAAAFGHAVVAHNRRAMYANGETRMYGRTNEPGFIGIEAGADHSLDMLFFWNRAGKLRGLVLAVPCPSQVDEHLELWSADYWHETRQELRRRFGRGLAILPLCGAAGDQSPHFLLQGDLEAEMRRRRGVTERQEIAQKIADGVGRALACTKPPRGSTAFGHLVRRRKLAPCQVSKAERDWAATARREWLKTREPNSWWPQQLQQVVDTYAGRVKPSPVPVELHAVRIGDAVLTTNPFELFLDYAERIKARSPAAQTFVVQLAAGGGWYLPTARGVAGGSYSAMPAVCQVAPAGGQQLVEETLRMIGRLVPRQRSPAKR